MSCQAVIRNNDNQLVINQNVGVMIRILKGLSIGAAVYSETQTPLANANGLISIEIGGGISSDNFSTIKWSDGPYYLKTEIDPAGGANYTIIGVSQLLSVPFALHAKTADNISNFNALQLNGICLPYTFGPDTDFVGTEGSFIGFGHHGVSEDFISCTYILIK
ncbi:MAG: hypothetical protein R6W78_12390 [Bacteroidales bacterium]